MSDDETAVQQQAEDTGDKQLGRVALKRVAVSRADREQQKRERVAQQRQAQNPMNQLVPYLDLFTRLDDEELSNLSGVSPEVVGTLRKQVIEVKRVLQKYVDLLPRLTDEELGRLTGVSEKTVRFWRLCRPKLDELDADKVESAGTSQSADSNPLRNPTADSSGVPKAFESQSSTPLEGVAGDPFPGYEDGGAPPPPTTGGDEEGMAEIDLGDLMDDDEDDLELEEADIEF